MAGYRPKSLEELNSLYDKSLNAKNEIEKKASGFETKAEVKAALPAEEPEAQEKTGDEIASEQIAGLVDNFIKNFGEPVPIKKVRPSTVTAAAVKPVAPVKPTEGKKQEEPQTAATATYNTFNERPKLIRNSERNDLFENYKKVMDDDDDYEYTHHSRKGRKRGKKLFEKKSAAVIDEAEQVTVAEETAEEAAIVAETLPEAPASEEVISQVQEDKPVYEIIAKEEPEEEVAPTEEYVPQAEEAEAHTVSEEAPAQELAAVEEAVETAEEVVEEVAEEEPATETAEEENEPQQEEAAAEEPEENLEAVAEPVQTEGEAQPEVETVTEAPVKKKFAGKNLLLILLFLVIFLATAVSAVKAFSGINSDSLLLGKYHLYSAQSSYQEAGIKKGDLVVVLHEAVEEGDIFAHKKGDGEYAFSKLDSVLNEESVVADNDGQKTIVFKNTVRGVFYKIYPAVGTVAALVMENYIYVIGALAALALILAVIIALSFRKKKKVEKEEEKEEAQQEPAADANAEYESIEGDFRYLIQEEAEEDYDVYRQGEESSQEEGLPVYQPYGDDYKYEPDEYVTK